MKTNGVQDVMIFEQKYQDGDSINKTGVSSGQL
jgi:hypothetical protein